MGRTIRIVVSLVLFAGGLSVATGTFPADVDEVQATGYGCTASGGATLHEFEYSGTKYCTEEFKAGGTWTRPSWVSDVYLMVVGGGGAGCSGSGTVAGGGGGGGGVAHGSISVTGTSSFTVTVGAGGSTSCSSGAASSFVGGSVNWVGNGGSGGSTNGGASGTAVKNGSTVTSSYAGGTGNSFNGSPQIDVGGGGGGATQAGSKGEGVSYSGQYNVQAVNGETVNNLTAYRIAWQTTPMSGWGVNSTGLLPSSSQRYLGCGGSGGYSWSYISGFLVHSNGLDYSINCPSAGKGGIADLLSKYSSPTYYGWLYCYSASIYCENTRTYSNPTAGLANSGSGGGGATWRYDTNTGVGGAGGSGVVLVRYAAPVPVNNTAPSISPTATPWVGNTITRTAGTWTDPLGGSLTYSGQWVRKSGATLTDIAGETGPTYEVTAADIGYTLLYRETADNGTATASAVSSETVVVIGAPAFTTNSPPSIAPTGTAFSYTFVASGGDITYTTFSGTLPTGLSLSTSGVLSGTPTVAGSYTFTVRATNAAGTADSPHTIHIGRASTPNPSTATEQSDVPFTATPTITLTQGASVEAGVSITVSVTSSPGSHSLTGTTTRTTDVAGIATFDDLELIGVAGAYTLSFDAGPEWPVATVSVTLSAGEAVALAMATQPVGNVQVDTNFTTPPAVKIVDSAGNTVTTDNSTVVTASLVTPPGGVSLVNGSATASSGVATFTNVQVTGGIGTFALGFASTPAYTAVTSSTFTILGIPQNITFGSLPNKTLGDTPFVVSASVDSNLPLTFTSTTPSVCSAVSASTTSAVVSLLDGGTCTIEATQPGDLQYSAATPALQSFTVNPIAQTSPLTMENATVEFGRSLTLTSAGGSGTGVVTYGLPNGIGTAECAINGDQLTHSKVGTCDVQASKASDDGYQSAQSTLVTITVVKARQTVEFTSTPAASVTVSAATYVATATASSNLPVTTSIDAASTAVCTSTDVTSPMTVSFIGEGNCILRATIGASTNYEAADEPAVQTIVVGPADGGGLQNQTISFASLSDMSIGDASIVLSATTSANLPVSFSSTTTGVCALTGRVLAVVATGRCVVTATQAGNSTFAAASPVVRAFTVSPTTPHAPGLRGVSGQAGAIRVSFTPPAFDGGSPILSYRVIATPTSGTPIVSDACTSSPCTIAGLVTGTSYTVTMRARNAVGWGAESSASVAVTPTANPVAVQNVSVVAGNGTLDVSWDDPADFGGGSCTAYELRIRVAGGTWPGAATTTSACPSSGTHTFSGLTPGTAYDVQIVTITSLLTTATDTNTAVVSGIPVGPPNAPRQLSVIDSGAGQITLYWAAPLVDGGASIIGYEVLVGSTSCGSVTIDPTSSAGTCVASGLTSQATYVITVRARNVFGLGASHTGSHTVAAHNAGTGGGGGGGGGGTTSDDDDDDDGENDGDDNDSGNGDGVPRPGGPDAPPLPGNDDDDDGFPDPWIPNPDPNNRPGIPCSGCVQVFPAPSGDGGPQPGVTSSPPGSRPGIIQVSTGTGPVVTIGGANSDGRPSTATSPNGGLIVGPGGNVPIVLTGLKPGSTVTVWLADQFSVSGVVGPDGTISLIASVPNDLPPGTYTGRVDMVDPSGQAQSILFGFEWVGRYGMLPVTGSDGVEALVIVLWMFVGGALIVAMSRRRHLL